MLINWGMITKYYSAIQRTELLINPTWNLKIIPLSKGSRTGERTICMIPSVQTESRLCDRKQSSGCLGTRTEAIGTPTRVRNLGGEGFKGAYTAQTQGIIYSKQIQFVYVS